MSVILKETGAEEIALRKFDTGKMFGFQREKKMDFANYKMGLTQTLREKRFQRKHMVF